MQNISYLYPPLDICLNNVVTTDISLIYSRVH